MCRRRSCCRRGRARRGRRRRQPDPGRRFIYGYSLGGALAIALAAERDGIAGGVILSTCNRVEVCVLSDAGYKGVEHVKDFLAGFHGIPIGELSDHLYHYLGEEAVRHLFRVCSSLDSMVLGEPQILGQVKDAYGYACEFKTIGPVLDKFFTKSFSVAKRVRTETRVANSAVSVSYAAVELAKKILGDLPDKVVMLIAAAALAAPIASMAAAHGGMAKSVDNWRSADGTLVWKNGTNELCWRDANWTPATAAANCDGAIKPAAPRAAAPAPARAWTRTRDAPRR